MGQVVEPPDAWSDAVFVPQLDAVFADLAPTLGAAWMHRWVSSGPSPHADGHGSEYELRIGYPTGPPVTLSFVLGEPEIITSLRAGAAEHDPMFYGPSTGRLLHDLRTRLPSAVRALVADVAAADDGSTGTDDAPVRAIWHPRPGRDPAWAYRARQLVPAIEI